MSECVQWKRPIVFGSILCLRLFICLEDWSWSCTVWVNISSFNSTHRLILMDLMWEGHLFSATFYFLKRFRSTYSETFYIQYMMDSCWLYAWWDVVSSSLHVLVVIEWTLTFLCLLGWMWCVVVPQSPLLALNEVFTTRDTQSYQCGGFTCSN